MRARTAFCVCASAGAATRSGGGRSDENGARRRVVSRRHLFRAATAAAAASSLFVDTAALAESDLQFRVLPSGLSVQDLRLGVGAQPKLGAEVTVRWTGRLTARYGWPYQREGAEETYRLGVDKLISGFEEGVLGMREKGKRRLVIPDALGYATGTESPRPRAFGDRRRLESTVANARRVAGAGAVVIDVELIRVRMLR